MFNAQIDDTLYFGDSLSANSCSIFFLHRFESYDNINWVAEVLEGDCSSLLTFPSTGVRSVLSQTVYFIGFEIKIFP